MSRVAAYLREQRIKPTARTNYTRNPKPVGAPASGGFPMFGNYSAAAGEEGGIYLSSASTAVLGRTNLCVQPYPADSAWWGDGTASDPTFETAGHPDGVPWMRSVVNTTAPNYVTMTLLPSPSTRRVPVTPGESITVSADLIYSKMPSVRAGVYAAYYTSTGAFLTNDVPVYAPTASPGEWFRSSHTFVVPAEAATMIPAASIGATAGWSIGDYAGITKVLVERHAVLLPFFAGDTYQFSLDSDDLYLHAWSGTANQSASTQSIRATPGAVGPHGHPFARRVTSTPKPSGSTGWQARAGTYSAPIAGPANDPLTISLWMRYGGIGAWRTLGTGMRLLVVSAGVEVTVANAAIRNLIPNVWTEVFVSGVTVDAYTEARWWAYQSSGAASTTQPGTVLDICGSITERTGEKRAWFDGSTPGAAWLGTADQSPSTITQFLLT